MVRGLFAADGPVGEVAQEELGGEEDIDGDSYYAAGRVRSVCQFID